MYYLENPVKEHARNVLMLLLKGEGIVIKG